MCAHSVVEMTSVVTVHIVFALLGIRVPCELVVPAAPCCEDAHATSSSHAPSSPAQSTPLSVCSSSSATPAAFAPQLTELTIAQLANFLDCVARTVNCLPDDGSHDYSIHAQDEVSQVQQPTLLYDIRGGASGANGKDAHVSHPARRWTCLTETEQGGDDTVMMTPSARVASLAEEHTGKALCSGLDSCMTTTETNKIQLATIDSAAASKSNSTPLLSSVGSSVRTHQQSVRARLDFFDYDTLHPLSASTRLCDAQCVLVYCAPFVASDLADKLQKRWSTRTSNLFAKSSPSMVAPYSALRSESELTCRHTMLRCNKEEKRVHLRRALQALQQLAPMHRARLLRERAAVEEWLSCHRARMQRAREELGEVVAEGTPVLAGTDKNAQQKSHVRTDAVSTDVAHETRDAHATRTDRNDAHDARHRAEPSANATAELGRDGVCTASPSRWPAPFDATAPRHLFVELNDGLVMRNADASARSALRTGEAVLRDAQAMYDQISQQCDIITTRLTSINCLTTNDDSNSSGEAGSCSHDESCGEATCASLPPIPCHTGTTLTELQHLLCHTLHEVRHGIACMTHVCTQLHQLSSRFAPALRAITAQLDLACATAPAIATAEQLQRRRLVLLRAVRRILRPLKLARDELESEITALLTSAPVCAGALPARVKQVLLRPLPSLHVETLMDVMPYLDERVLESHDVDETEELLQSMGGGQWWWGAVGDGARATTTTGMAQDEREIGQEKEI